MLSKHVKSPCCGVKAVHFGGRRRQCPLCKTTWRIRPARRGRKARRLKHNYLSKVFSRGLHVRHIPTTWSITQDAVRKRFDKVLDQFVNQPRRIKIRGRKLILIIDAQMHDFDGITWTLYFLAIKPVSKDTAIFLDPILRRGKENAAEWEQLIRQLPDDLKKRIIAFISDGLRGLNRIPRQYGWVHQRCCFHLISELQKRRGKRKTTKGRRTREDIFQTVLRIIVVESQQHAVALKRKLERLIIRHDCPSRMRMIVKDMFRNLSKFRSYLYYPEMNLPNTTNVMESLNKVVRRKSETVRTPQSWYKWATATVRFKPIFVCQRAKKSTKLFP